MNFIEHSSGLLVPDNSIKAHGRYFVEHIRNGEVIDREYVDNLVVNQGLDYMLGTALTGVAQISSWYLGIFSNNYSPTANDTAATISTNSGEVTAAYNGSTRPVFTGVESAQQVTNSASQATFTFNADTNVYGAFLISSSGKGSASGVLFSATLFSAPKAMKGATSDQLGLGYTVGAATS